MRILLIEDYLPLQKSLAKGLREADFAVYTSGDGQEGLWYAMSNDYDVIILDLMLPKIDGLSVLKQLRAKNKNNHVLILTAKDTVEDRIKGLDLGADDYLVKPFAFGELLARIKALTRRRYEQKSPDIKINDLRIDTSAKRVWLGDEEIILTAREFMLLEYLARRAGQVVSRTEIWEHIYEFKSEASSNVVDVYIGYLRKKIEKKNKSPILQTVRGQGYILKA
jgi:DNA-binding response OmpR family regulator